MPSSHCLHELERQARVRAENKARLNEIKWLLGCQWCQRHELPLHRFHFHHEGRYRWPVSRRLHRSWPNLVQELKETVVLCDSCHGHRTAGLFTIPAEIRVIVPSFLVGTPSFGVGENVALLLPAWL